MIPKELTPPAALFIKVPYPGWNGTVSISSEPRVLRRLIPRPEKAECIAARDAALANGRACRILAGRANSAARKEYGDKGGLNPCPISGGVCEEWPRDVIDGITDLLHAKEDWNALALAWHILAGNRAATFRALPGLAL